MDGEPQVTSEEKVAAVCIIASMVAWVVIMFLWLGPAGVREGWIGK